MGWARWIAVSLIALAAFAQAQERLPPAVVDIPSGADVVPVPFSFSLAPRGAVHLEQVAAGTVPGGFTSAPDGAPLVAFDETNEAWVVVRLRNPSAAARGITLQVLQTAMDEVVLYERLGDRWRESIAGDLVPRAQWTLQGRYARFELQLEASQTRTVVLRTRNSTPTVLFLEAARPFVADVSYGRASFGLAAALGALFVLVVASLVQAALYRETAYFVFSAYAALLGLALASISGMADDLIWRDWTWWADRAKTVAPLAAAGLSVLMVKVLVRAETRARELNWAATLAAMLVLAAAATCLVMPPHVAVVAAGFAIAASTVIALAVWAWRWGDSMGPWVLVAHAPLIATTALVILRRAGVLELQFRMNVLVGLSIGCILLLMLVALIRRSKELLALRDRDMAMKSIDPLTGLLSGPAFTQRVVAAAGRYRRSRHDAAVVFVRLANFGRIHDLHGAATADRNLIRAAIKIQRAFHNADTFGRVGECTFGFIIETVTHREVLQERAARLVAHGLMVPPGLDPPVVLVLHVASGLFSSSGLDAQGVIAALENELGAMSTRTRRPIRFLEDGAAQGPGSDDERGTDAS